MLVVPVAEEKNSIALKITKMAYEISTSMSTAGRGPYRWGKVRSNAYASTVMAEATSASTIITVPNHPENRSSPWLPPGASQMWAASTILPVSSTQKSSVSSLVASFAPRFKDGSFASAHLTCRLPMQATLCSAELDPSSSDEVSFDRGTVWLSASAINRSSASL
uniref:Uncharacterized protein n=1 Tax=Anopheles merus TaxID=30066 RepID=A0A182UX51_ANOME